MEPLYYVMAIMGCADDGALCSQARLAAPRYTSYQACQAAMDAQLIEASDLAFPVIEARCRGTRPIMADTGSRPQG